MVHDRTEGGEHYASNTIQPWDIIDEYQLDFYAGNVIKYLLRNASGNKKPKYSNSEHILEDLRKAQHYLAKMIEDRTNRQGEGHAEI